MNEAKQIVILGSGVGGLTCARRLREKLGRGHKIVLIDHRTEYVLGASLLWIATGQRKPEEVTKNLSGVTRLDITFVPEEITRIDLQSRVVHTTSQEIGFDYLVIALGAAFAMEKIPGLATAGFNLYTLPDAVRLHKALVDFPGGRIAVLVSALPFKCPAAPHETAFLVDWFLTKRGVRPKTQIQLFTPEPLPMPAAGPEIGQVVKGMLVGRGVTPYFQHKATAVDPAKKEISFENGQRVQFDLLIIIPPHVSPRVVQEAQLTGDSGWIPVDRYTLRTEFEGVYAIGDVTGIKIGSGFMLPKAAVFAQSQAEVVAHNIACQIKGSGNPYFFDGVGACYLETGYGKAGYAMGNFFVEPRPQVVMKKSGRLWHWAKVRFERRWRKSR